MRPITDGRSKAGSIAFLELRQDRTAAGKFPVTPFSAQFIQKDFPPPVSSPTLGVNDRPWTPNRNRLSVLRRAMRQRFGQSGAHTVMPSIGLPFG